MIPCQFKKDKACLTYRYRPPLKIVSSIKARVTFSPFMHVRIDRYKIVLITLFISCIVCRLTFEFPITYKLLEIREQGINYLTCL